MLRALVGTQPRCLLRRLRSRRRSRRGSSRGASTQGSTSNCTTAGDHLTGWLTGADLGMFLGDATGATLAGAKPELGTAHVGVARAGATAGGRLTPWLDDEALLRECHAGR